MAVSFVFERTNLFEERRAIDVDHDLARKGIILTTTPETTELEELAFALGVDLVANIYQRRPQPDPQFFLGSGKMEDVRDSVRALGASLVLVNGALRPGQVFGLQSFMGNDAEGRPIEVFDRTRLILEIFRDRARSPEARLQVELAQLEYDMPLAREAISREKRGERQAAMFGGGDFGVEAQYDAMKKRMTRIRRDLDRIRGERDVRRKHRRRSGFHLVSLAGYTNAGKSSLLKALSDRHVLAENRYFSTLSTKTARAKSEKREILVTDTVGFIEDLPPWMVEAFHSTLEEIALADVILLVLDASDPVDEMARRLRSSLRILHEFDIDVKKGSGAANATNVAPYRRGLAPILVALNKIDRVEGGAPSVDAKRRALEEQGLLSPDMSVALSAVTRDGLPELYERLYGLIPDYDEYEVALPLSPEAETAIGWLRENTDVLDMTRGNETHVHFEAKRSFRTELARRLKEAGASPLQEVLRLDGSPPASSSSSSSSPTATDETP